MSRHEAQPSLANEMRELQEDNLNRTYGRRIPLPGFGKHRAEVTA